MKLLTGSTASKSAEKPQLRLTSLAVPRTQSGAWNAFVTGLAAGIAATLITIYHPAGEWTHWLSQDASRIENPAPQNNDNAVPATVLDRYEAMKKQVEDANQRILAADQRVFDLEKRLAEARQKADNAQGMLNGVLANIEQKAIVDSQQKPSHSLKELAQQLNPDVVAWLLSADDHLALCTKTY